MHTSQFLVLLAGAATSVSAQQSKATLFNLLPMEPTETATLVGSNSAATTYSFGCPASKGSAVASAISSAKSSASGAVSSAIGSLTSAVGNVQLTAIPKPTNARRGDDIRLLPIPKPSHARRGDDIRLLPIPKPSHARRGDDIRLLPIPKPSHARRDDIRLLPIAKPTLAARDLPWGKTVDCIPYTIVQGPQTWSAHMSYSDSAFKLNIDASATWKGEFAKATDVAASVNWGGDLTMFNTQLQTTAPATEFFPAYTVPVVSGAVTPTGSTTSASGAHPTSSSASNGTPASGSSKPSAPMNSAFAASGPLPTGAAAFFGAAAGIFGAALAL